MTGCALSRSGAPLEAPLPTFLEATGAPGGAIGATRIVNASQLVAGPAATGRIGDFLLYNDLIRVVIADIPHASGFARSGGNILDAAVVGSGADQLSHVFTYLDDTFPRQLIYDHLYITENGANLPVAEIVLTGRDSMNPSVSGVTRYQLEIGKPWVRITTTLTNHGNMVLRDYELGDALQWGMTEHFVPGYGIDVSGRATVSGWLAALGDGVSYGLTTGLHLTGFHGSNWSDVKSGVVNLSRGGSVSYERYFIIGAGDTESIARVAADLRHDLVERLEGSAVEMGGNRPVEGARIEARLAANDKSVGFALSGPDGRFRLTLPPSEYKLTVSHPARGSAEQDIAVDLTRGNLEKVVLHLTPPARLLYRVVEAQGGLIPCKLTFRGVDGTADPYFGHASKGPGSNDVYFAKTGQGELQLPPGRYQITVSRGIEYSIRQETVTLPAGKEQVLAVTLEHEVDPVGFVSADFNQLTAYSDNAWVDPADVIVANLAEGVDVVVITDVGHLTDLRERLQTMGVSEGLRTLVGQQLVSPTLGSVNVWPMVPQLSQVGNGAFQFEALAPPALFEALLADGSRRVIQVNQPREGDEGYFNLLELDPQTVSSPRADFSFGFNTLEVLSGKRMKGASSVLRDWFLLLNRGYQFTATGNSNSRRITTQERGYPRNYVGLPPDQRESFTDTELAVAVLERREIVVTNGPFIEVTANRKGRIGSMLTLPKGAQGQAPEVTLDVVVKAPKWIEVNEIEVIANGEVIRRLPAQAPREIVKFRDTIVLSPARDTWYVVIARGFEGMDPVVPRYKGSTIAPFAFTNPIWVDVDQDHAFDPLFSRDSAAPGYIPVPLELIE